MVATCWKKKIIKKIKRETGLLHQLRLVWFWGPAWRICAFVLRNHGRRLEPGLQDYPLLLVNVFLSYSSIFFIFASFQKFRAAFSCENTCQTRMITISFPPVLYFFLMSFNILQWTRFGIWRNFDYCGGTRLNLHVFFLPPVYPIYGAAENGKMWTWKSSW